MKPTIDRPIDYSRVKRGVFVSDLHLFSSRSAPGLIKRELQKYSDEDQCIVLGGDIFDFRWSDKGGFEPTIQAASDWLENLLKNTGDCQIIFLPGNHDSHPEFLAHLDQIARGEERFEWHEHLVRLKNCLFLHGDILDAGLDENRLAEYRNLFHHEGEPSKVLDRSYDLAVAMRVHKLIPRVRRRKSKTCDLIGQALKNVDVQEMQKVDQVYFGHTHQPILGLEQGGLTYFNPGAALKHMRYHMHDFELEE
jgi:UDP-2,3-diacylglucosamine hydrolase